MPITKRTINSALTLILIPIFLLASCVSTPPETEIPMTTTPDYPATWEAREVHAATWFAESTQFYLATLRAPTLTRTPIIIPSKTATPTITPTPTKVPPLEAHEWVPGNVLIRMWGTQGDSGGFIYVGPPELILYSNGLLILSGEEELFGYNPLYKILSRSEVCLLLNTIDQIGYFGYESNAGQSYFAGMGAQVIDVFAWRSNTSSFQGLKHIIYCDQYSITCEEASELDILPELRQTFLLLDNYYPSGMTEYDPGYLVIYFASSFRGLEGNPWPIYSPTLKEISAKANPVDNYGTYIVDGYSIVEWHEQVPNGNYYEGDLQMQIYVQPVYPHQSINSDNTLRSGVSPTSPPDFTLSCSPEDGVLPIPDYP